MYYTTELNPMGNRGQSGGKGVIEWKDQWVMGQELGGLLLVCSEWPDIGQGFYRPETGSWAWELNSGPTKRSYCDVRSLNPGLTKQCAHEERKNTFNIIMTSMWKHVLGMMGDDQAH